MIALNLSVDFELGWGDLDRLTHDDDFYRRVVAGLEQSRNVIALLEQNAIPSTWGVVAGCCCASLDELRERAPRGFKVIEPQLDALARKRPAYPEALFCADTVKAIAQSGQIELGSHSFMHLVPNGLPTDLLRDDVSVSVQVLRAVAGKDVVSFIPPQNYHWPDEAFRESGIRYVRHTPKVFGRDYSEPNVAAKLARLWNDFVAPASYPDPPRASAKLLFLRIDRGERLWNAQLMTLRRLLAAAEGSLFVFTHPHNLDTSGVIRRFAALCELIVEKREQGKLTFRGFLREVPALS